MAKWIVLVTVFCALVVGLTHRTAPVYTCPNPGQVVLDVWITDDGMTAWSCGKAER